MRRPTMSCRRHAEAIGVGLVDELEAPIGPNAGQDHRHVIRHALQLLALAGGQGERSGAPSFLLLVQPGAAAPPPLSTTRRRDSLITLKTTPMMRKTKMRKMSGAATARKSRPDARKRPRS